MAQVSPPEARQLLKLESGSSRRRAAAWWDQISVFITPRYSEITARLTGVDISAGAFLMYLRAIMRFPTLRPRKCSIAVSTENRRFIRAGKFEPNAVHTRANNFSDFAHLAMESLRDGEGGFFQIGVSSEVNSSDPIPSQLVRSRFLRFSRTSSTDLYLLRQY